MEIRFLGAHNCESKNSRYTCLLIDDILAIDAGALTSSLSLNAQQELRAVLLTHQHYDHIRDIPALAMNHLLDSSSINIYSIQAVYDILSTHLMGSKIYPNFLERPEHNPTVKFTLMEPLKVEQIEGYSILPVPVTHTDPVVGYQVTSSDGKTMFYTSDTGPGLADCWRSVSPQLLITEVTASNKYEEFAKESGHLTPSLLEREMVSFREVKGYLPPVVLVHMNPRLEKEIEAEIASVARSLNNSITLAYEGMQLHI